MIVALAAAVALGVAPAAATDFLVEQVAGAPDQPRLLLAPRPGPRATLRIAFPTGAFDDGDVHGLTRLAQQALLQSNGALSWREFALALHEAGADLRVTTGQRDCAFTLTADARDFPALAGRLAAAVLAPRFDPSLLKAARARVSLLRDAGTGLLALVISIAGEDSRYVNRPIARPEELDTVTPAQVAGHLERHLAPANATVVVSGAFPRAAVIDAVRRYRGGTAAPPARLALPHPFQTRRLFDRELHVLALPVETDTPRRAAAARALRELLDLAIWQQFRETGVIYSHSVELVHEPWIDLLLVTLPEGERSGVDVAGRLRQALASLRSGGFADADLARARAAAMAELEEDDRDTVALARVLASGGADWHGVAVATALRTLDRGALLAATDAWLDPANAVYFYLGVVR